MAESSHMVSVSGQSSCSTPLGMRTTAPRHFTTSRRWDSAYTDVTCAMVLNAGKAASSSSVSSSVGRPAATVPHACSIGRAGGDRHTAQPLPPPHPPPSSPVRPHLRIQVVDAIQRRRVRFPPHRWAAGAHE